MQAQARSIGGRTGNQGLHGQKHAGRGTTPDLQRNQPIIKNESTRKRPQPSRVTSSTTRPSGATSETAMGILPIA